MTITAMAIFFTSCVSTNKDASVVKAQSMEKYNYVVIASQDTADSKELIAEQFSNHGYTVLNEVNKDNASQTLIVNYSDKEQNSNLFEYSTQVTINCISADNNRLVCKSTAEGMGETRADDIRIAVTKAVNGILN